MSAADHFAKFDEAQRAALCAALDEISRHLTVRELDVALAKVSIPRSARRPILRALSTLDIIAIVPRS